MPNVNEANGKLIVSCDYCGGPEHKPGEACEWENCGCDCLEDGCYGVNCPGPPDEVDLYCVRCSRLEDLCICVEDDDFV